MSDQSEPAHPWIVIDEDFYLKVPRDLIEKLAEQVLRDQAARRSAPTTKTCEHLDPPICLTPDACESFCRFHGTLENPHKAAGGLAESVTFIPPKTARLGQSTQTEPDLVESLLHGYRFEIAGVALTPNDGEKTLLRDFGVRVAEAVEARHRTASVDTWLDEADELNRAVLRRIDALMGAEANTPEQRELSQLAGLVQAYEAKRYPGRTDAGHRKAEVADPILEATNEFATMAEVYEKHRDAPPPPVDELEDTSAKSDTGNPEADRIINRLNSSDSDFDDRIAAVALIRKLMVEHKGPDNFETWKDAALSERKIKAAAEAREKAAAEKSRKIAQELIGVAKECVSLGRREAKLRAVLDFYACIDHYPDGSVPDVVRMDKGAKARAVLAGDANV